MKKKIFLRAAALLLVAVFLIPSVLCSCGSNVTADGATVLSFKSASSYDYLKQLDGQKVTIKGWFATMSPPDDSFLFLMNMPYQSCVFCKPNTNQLSNTIEVYPKEGKSLEFTSQVVQVVGTLTVAPLDKPYSDDFGYEFNYKIIDAEYFMIDDDELSPELILWQKISASDIVSEIYSMFDYLYFLCNWCIYTDKFDDRGKDYIHPDDFKTKSYIDNKYFDKITSKVLDIDKENLMDLVLIIETAKDLSNKAISELENKKYSSIDEYSVDKSGKLIFGDGRKQYKINNRQALNNELDDIYYSFSIWLTSWEL